MRLKLIDPKDTNKINRKAFKMQKEMFGTELFDMQMRAYRPELHALYLAFLGSLEGKHMTTDKVTQGLVYP